MACSCEDGAAFTSNGDAGVIGEGVDSDGDGLSDSEEQMLGSNPTSGDSDGDGYTDRQEYDFGSDPNDAGSTPAGEACLNETATANPASRPLDIIVAVDASGSMQDEIKGIESFINNSFAQILDEKGIDYQVTLIAYFGDSDNEVDGIPRWNGSEDGFFGICISQPLGGNTCDGGETGPNAGAKFAHIDQAVDSNDALDVLIYTYDHDAYQYAEGGASGSGLVPGGWATRLRDGALKFFVVFTDDTSDRDAESFEAWLFDSARGGAFGTAEARNYVFHGVIGVAEKAGDLFWSPEDGIQNEECDTASGLGDTYQQLSINSDGLRFSVCNDGNTTSYDQMFEELADNAIAGSQVPCQYALPPPPADKQYNFDGVILRYSATGGSVEEFRSVAAASDCGDSRAYYASGDSVRLCPQACSTVQSDSGAKVQLIISCTDGYVLR